MTRGNRTAAPGARAVGYLRVSTDEQADTGAGLAAQRASVTAEAQRRGWELVEISTDTASGRSRAGRPALTRALSLVASGEADVLIVAKLDRLSRSLRDFADVLATAQREGWFLVALDLGVDLSTPAGEFLAHVMASAAQWERRIIGQRTREALAMKRAAGVRLGRPAALPDPVVARIVHRRAAGDSLAVIADALNAENVATAQGGARWHASTVRAVLASQAASKFS
jgi:DNA invertase Pin-like site-specific DNA recombinase